MWNEIGRHKVFNLETAAEQYKQLGYPHRNILHLQCSNCNKVTCVDDSIEYKFCPHCGINMTCDFINVLDAIIKGGKE